MGKKEEKKGRKLSGHSPRFRRIAGEKGGEKKRSEALPGQSFSKENRVEGGREGKGFVHLFDREREEGENF